jgi:hypothetical protein
MSDRIHAEGGNKEVAVRVIHGGLLVSKVVLICSLMEDTDRGSNPTSGVEFSRGRHFQ